MANEEKPVLIIGATGTVGSEGLRATLAQGARVRALVRSPSSAARLPPQVEVILGDLRDERAVAHALSGVRAAFYVSPHEADEVELAERFIRACELARTRLVFVGVHVDGANRFTRALQRMVFGRLAPHYRPKFRIAERARTSATRPVILMPTNFFQNDELFEDEIQRGIYPTAFERAVNRVDVRDLGRAIARALLDEALPSGAYPVVGPASLDGDTCAELWSAAMGCKVRCERDPAIMQAAFLRTLPPKKRDDFLHTFKLLRNFELKTATADVEATRTLIGRAPTPYARYVRETAERLHQRVAPVSEPIAR